MTEVDAGVTNAVRRVLYEAGMQESRAVGQEGFHAWPSVRTPGVVFVDHKRNSDKFNYRSTNRWCNEQVGKYRNLLAAAGFHVVLQERPGIHRLQVMRLQ